LSEAGLPEAYYPELASGGTLQNSHTPDQRITNLTTGGSVETLPAGPFQLTNGKTFLYNDYAQSPVHRFYQMWQQLNCNVEQATADNPSGCDAKLFSWVEVTIGAGNNGEKQPALCSSDGDQPGCFSKIIFLEQKRLGKDRRPLPFTTCRRVTHPISLTWQIPLP
jgi:phospholipase C